MTGLVAQVRNSHHPGPVGKSNKARRPWKGDSSSVGQVTHPVPSLLPPISSPKPTRNGGAPDARQVVVGNGARKMGKRTEAGFPAVTNAPVCRTSKGWKSQQAPAHEEKAHHKLAGNCSCPSVHSSGLPSPYSQKVSGLGNTRRRSPNRVIPRAGGGVGCHVKDPGKQEPKCEGGTERGGELSGWKGGRDCGSGCGGGGGGGGGGGLRCAVESGEADRAGSGLRVKGRLGRLETYDTWRDVYGGTPKAGGILEGGFRGGGGSRRPRPGGKKVVSPRSQGAAEAAVPSYERHNVIRSEGSCATTSYRELADGSVMNGKVEEAENAEVKKSREPLATKLCTCVNGSNLFSEVPGSSPRSIDVALGLKKSSIGQGRFTIHSGPGMADTTDEIMGMDRVQTADAIPSKWETATASDKGEQKIQSEGNCPTKGYSMDPMKSFIEKLYDLLEELTGNHGFYYEHTNGLGRWKMDKGATEKDGVDQGSAKSKWKSPVSLPPIAGADQKREVNKKMGGAIAEAVTALDWAGPKSAAKKSPVISPSDGLVGDAEGIFKGPKHNDEAGWFSDDSEKMTHGSKEEPAKEVRMGDGEEAVTRLGTWSKGDAEAYDGREAGEAMVLEDERIVENGAIGGREARVEVVGVVGGHEDGGLFADVLASYPESPLRSPGKTEVYRGRYEVLQVVGEGAYGIVMQCKDHLTGEIVSIKEFKVSPEDLDADEVRRIANRELTLLQRLNHPNVVGYKEDFTMGVRTCIVMEFVPRNLLSLLIDKDGLGLEKDVVRHFIFELCKAISFMHEQNVIYRDVKPENLLITQDGHLKVCDFGFARHLDVDRSQLTPYVATRWYRAPELLIGRLCCQGRDLSPVYGKPVDMWAIGCLMGELIEGKPMFGGETDIDQLYQIQRVLGALSPSLLAKMNAPANVGFPIHGPPLTLRERYRGLISDQELSFMEGLLRLDPLERMSGKQCLPALWRGPLRGGIPVRRNQLLGFEYLIYDVVGKSANAYDAEGKRNSCCGGRSPAT
ncbi:hypothetical protein CBR_g41511 [Chara braunii]|uniref:Protein kinase domain-containing protein n=1 Tax=Chara braunii TaxID=69332 RepID=A0A388LW09_CHABU|nr:hypothetical protein CBR_g41511 [Chara braunii]|eukprot:GBG86517.1 hypothetical protein CBR_g41511 [Chara braunii]